MCNECKDNNKEICVEELVNLQTGMKIDMDKFNSLPDNAMLRVRPELWIEWDFVKNNALGFDVYKVSKGLNDKPWWICENGHVWDTSISNRVKGSSCRYCSGYEAWIGFNDLWTTRPNLAKLFFNHEDGYKYTQGSNMRVDWVCPNCGKVIKNKKIVDVKSKGLPCPTCSDGFSYPEKVMYHLLSSLAKEFEYQKTFKWSDNKRYDFYIPSLNMIIETHGIQHFEESGRGRSLQEEQANDNYKKELSLKNGIEHYIVIDCRYSSFEFIKENILDSELKVAFDLQRINWGNIEINSHKSIVKEISDIWNKGYSLKEIVNMMNLNINTVRNCLVNGVKTGLCDYTPDEARLRGISVSILNKEIVKLDLDGNYISSHKSIKEVALNDSMRTGISSVCRGIQISAIGFRWLYKEDYEKYLKNEIKLRPIGDTSRRNKAVVKLTKSLDYIETYTSIKEAASSNSIGANNITEVCRGKKKSAAGFKWMYLKDYEEYPNNK
ncbi:zinc-ribbon domain-containing protein [Ureibacillus chungkukjangi]|uniref:zinc-ribbon domain-containing protein n=1 Tax=Ureibacillus chungkukjangi TaxID=1202712 RepID=UPI00203C2797|nr:zinc-ribbon domain-containing protein [Ureibacillus chungkukjangi]